MQRVLCACMLRRYVIVNVRTCGLGNAYDYMIHGVVRACTCAARHTKLVQRRREEEKDGEDVGAKLTSFISPDACCATGKTKVLPNF